MKKSQITTLSIVIILMGFLTVRSFLKKDDSQLIEETVVEISMDTEAKVSDSVSEQKSSIKKPQIVKKQQKSLTEKELFEIKDKKIKTLLKLSGAQSRLDGMEDKIDEYLQLTKANASMDEEQFKELQSTMNKVMNIEELRNRFAKMAHQKFSAEELDQLVEIYEQPEMQTIHGLFEKMETSEFIEDYQAYKAERENETVDEVRESMIQEIIEVTKVAEITTETTVNFTAAFFKLQRGEGEDVAKFKDRFRQQMEERIGDELNSAYSFMFSNVTNEEMRVYLESHQLPIMQKMVQGNLESMKEYFNNK